MGCIKKGRTGETRSRSRELLFPVVLSGLNSPAFFLAGEGGTDRLHVGVQALVHLADAAAAGSRSAAADAGRLAAVQPGRGGMRT